MDPKETLGQNIGAPAYQAADGERLAALSVLIRTALEPMNHQDGTNEDFMAEHFAEVAIGARA